MTEEAIKNSKAAMRKDSVLNNPSVVKALTSSGGKITDWDKLTTQSIKIPTGQSIQVHFYQNKLTGEVNYTHPDFKIKSEVDPFYNEKVNFIFKKQ